MKLSVIMPCFNEAMHVERALDAVMAVDIPKEVIVVDDGSTDSTHNIVANYCKGKDILLHASLRNYGKGAAIRAGLTYASGDIVIIQDADLEYDPNQFHKMIEPIVNGSADVVYGSRFMGHITGMKLANRIANRILTFTANVLYNARITDEATCYKAFRAKVLMGLNLKACRFEFCPEVTAKIRKKGIAIKEVPIEYTARHESEGKKIRWTDAFSAMWTLIKYRFVD
jgi:glycosyltransferase involved in cell wall biosynthesis